MSNLPPGCSYSDIDPGEGQCLCCGREAGDCICPECPKCGAAGDPMCYEEESHGLVYSDAQRAGIAQMQEQRRIDAEADAAMAQQLHDDYPM